ncbi:MAG: TerD family protein [Candidatus Competibacteraceae bacterium]|jgi:tellurite resistance protein TerA|nr:TerD family protein [Candidatus Competibacteraceae bacterium]
MNLQPGQNISITKQSPTTRSIEVVLQWEPPNSPLELDSSAFALTAQGKVRGDEDFVFYNQPTLSGGGIQRSTDGKQFTVDFQSLPSAIDKIALTLTVHQGQRRRQSFSQLRQVTVELRDAQSKVGIATFPLATGGMPETALVVAELYRRNNEWKFRAVGQGFVGGLGPLASHFGVAIDDDPDVAAPPPPQPAAGPASPVRNQPAPQPTPSPAARPVRLEKITLEKKQPVSLKKIGQGFDKIIVNLNWNQAPPASGGGGFLGGLFASKQGTDLDLGCLFELNVQHQGRPIVGAIQALGNSFGNFDQMPFIRLLGDDRSGNSAEGEFLHINGRQWEQIRRVLIFAFIYEGVPNWAAADAVVTINTPGQPTLEVRLDSHRNDQGMCAIALLENTGGNIQVTKLMDYFQSHQYMDSAYKFGLRWTAGKKD